MKTLYEAGSMTARVHEMFEGLLRGFTKPTRWLLAFVATAMIAVGITRSIRDLYRRYLSKVTEKSLNACYYALAYAKDKEPHASMRALASKVLEMIPAELRDYPIFLLIDDTLIEKFGRKFAQVGILFDHAAHDGRPYKNGHCFVSLMLCAPIRREEDGKVTYLSVPLEHQMWKKGGDSKLQMAKNMITEVLPALEHAAHIVLLCDSWYTKSPFIDLITTDERIDIIAAARSDTFMAEPEAPERTGKRGRPRKWGDPVKLTDFELRSGAADDYLVGSREVRTRLFGDRVVTAIVTQPADGSESRRLFLMSMSEQKLAELMHMDAEEAVGLGLSVYHSRWSLEAFYEVSKLFWQFGDYMVRTENGIERLVNLISLAYAGMLILPYTDADLAYMIGWSLQDIRFEIGTILRDEVFSARLVSELKRRDKPAEFIQEVKDAICALNHAA